MAQSLTERLIATLSKCPCCGGDPHNTSGPDDGISSAYVHETLFVCGSRISVDTSNNYVCSDGCKSVLDWRLDDLFEEVFDAFEADEGDPEGGGA